MRPKDVPSPVGYFCTINNKLQGIVAFKLSILDMLLHHVMSSCETVYWLDSQNCECLYVLQQTKQ